MGILKYKLLFLEYSFFEFIRLLVRIEIHYAQVIFFKNHSDGGHPGKAASRKRNRVCTLGQVFNLKQMVQNTNYFAEYDLIEYTVLEEQAATE